MHNYLSLSQIQQIVQSQHSDVKTSDIYFRFMNHMHLNHSSSFTSSITTTQAEKLKIIVLLFIWTKLVLSDNPPSHNALQLRRQLVSQNMAICNAPCGWYLKSECQEKCKFYYETDAYVLAASLSRGVHVIVQKFTSVHLDVYSTVANVPCMLHLIPATLSTFHFPAMECG